jgi:predicted  nucleic acid-binding Zn-ribbon protein
MQEVLGRLLELQEVDNRIYDIEKSKRDFPQTIKQLRKETDDFEGEIQEKTDQLKALEKEQRHFEQEIEKANEFLKKSQDRLSGVKNNREYDALQEQIDVQREKISESETEVIRILNATEELQKELTQKRAGCQAVREKNDAEIGRLETLLSSIEEKKAVETEERKKITVRVDKKLLTTYERIRDGYKNGVAVARIKRGACGGCFQRIPPQAVAEIKKQERIMRCETCGRILIWVEGE